MQDDLDALKRTIEQTKSKTLDIAVGVPQLACDETVLEHIPIVKHWISVGKITEKYRKNRLIKNCEAFLCNIRQLDKSSIESLERQLFADDQLALNSAETILDIVVDAENPLKASLVGSLAQALAKGYINLDDFYALSLIIYSGSVAALSALRAFYEENKLCSYQRGMADPPCQSLISSLGLGTKNGTMFRVNVLGELLARYGHCLNISLTSETS